MPQLDAYKSLESKDIDIALVGATNSKSKYGNIIFHNLLNKGYRVHPVNPRATTVDGHKAYKTLAELKDAVENVDLINVVIPAKMGLEVIREAKELGLDNLWFQPGAESQEIVDECERLDMTYIVDACTMVVARA